ncbi:MAG: VWA domain-containing protein [Candidatus Nanohaloarchaea archaeon]
MMAGFENPNILALLVLALPGLYLAWKRDERFKQLIGVSRFVIIALLIAAAASPFITSEQKVARQPEITVLKDSSTSTDILDSMELETEKIEVREKTIASGNTSDLKNGLLRNLEPNTNYLVVSDFQSSTPLKEVAARFNQANSTLNALKTETEAEASVTVSGPEETVPGAKNRFTVRVESTGDIPEPTVKLDGSEVELLRTSNSTWRFRKKFATQGSHTITASIDVSDHWSRNNRYYHAVEVTEKPDVLIVGSEESLGDKLEKFYDVKYRNSVPEDLSSYYTVILKKDPGEVGKSRLTPYVTEGNGLVYTGDYNSDMNILPVKSVSDEQQTKGAKVMMVIDVSKSTGETGSVKKEKKIAYNLVEKLPFNNRVGLVAYNEEAYLINRPKPLASYRDQLKQNIARLETGGNSFHHIGLKGGKKALNETGNMILITDGRITAFGRNINTERKSKEIASSLEVRLITVGVGDDQNEAFLRDLAERGNGLYLDAQDSGRLQFMFNAGGAAGRTEPLVTVNPDHFITEGLKLSSSAAVFDSVKPRTGADLLVTSTSGKPFLSTWHYGLGRVAAFSGGSKDLSGVTRIDPLLATRTVSWTVGDPKRKQDKWLTVESSRRPENPEARASYDAPGFKRQGRDLFTRELDPESLGFHGVEGHVYGYNYNPEIEEVGYSESMSDVVRDTGGKVYTPDEKQEIISDVRQFSNREIVAKKSVSGHLIFLALLVFLAEVGYRKLEGKK